MTTDEGKKSFANAYASLMEMAAWRDVVQFIKDEKAQSIKRLDDKSAKDVSLSEYCEERGYRKGLEKILQHAEFRKSGV